ncbi:MAG TPA: agmatine deiminase family protein [Bryobacteraceae bacterium]|nr:agmatine deiminase family protein [Bryobacteraceae bacterium]
MASQFRMPAEWEPHEGTWIAWPHEKSDWPGKFAPIPWVYCEIVKHLARGERVHILVNNADQRESAEKMLRRAGANLAAVSFTLCPTNRSWTRDYCPIFVRKASGEPVILNWRFNGWAKYGDWKTDDDVPSRIVRQLRLPQVKPAWKGGRIVLEGGSIDVNGQGSLLTTEECLLSPIQARNPGLERLDMEAIFREYLGVEKTIWLKNGIAGDDTHGHVDDLARFVNTETVVLAVEQDPMEVNYEPLRENLRILKALKQVKVIPLPMPQPLYFNGQRLPASYANFYIANDRVLMPTFNDRNDRLALNILAKLFPTREIVGIHAVDLVLGLGTLHCLTQQQIG